MSMDVTVTIYPNWKIVNFLQNHNVHLRTVSYSCQNWNLKSSFKNSVSLLGILTNPHIYSHKSGKNVAMIKNKKTDKSQEDLLSDAICLIFLWLCGHK